MDELNGRVMGVPMDCAMTTFTATISPLINLRQVIIGWLEDGRRMDGGWRRTALVDIAFWSSLWSAAMMECILMSSFNSN